MSNDDIIAEMARVIDDMRPFSNSDALAHACWAVVEKRMGWRPIETSNSERDDHCST